MSALTASTFRTDEPLLTELLSDIHKCTLQLPDFQRGWVWDDSHIRALLASVSMSYPIGAIMLLETGGDGVQFRPRKVEGVPLEPVPQPDSLILDGQQRMTSLYLTLMTANPIDTKTDKGQEIQRLYYLDMTRCLDPETERLDAVISLPPDRILKSDFGRQIDLDASTREKEYELGLFPLNLVFNPPEFSEWTTGFQEYHEYKPDKIRLASRFQNEIWLRFQQYKVPVIVLQKGTSKVAVCQVFERVNTGGVTLSVFELVTATFAAEDFQLRRDWAHREEKLHAVELLQDVDATSYLTAVTLLSSFNRSLAESTPVGCKRKDVLNLKVRDYEAFADQILAGFKAAAKFLAREKVFDARSVPYQTQLIPLAAICAQLGSQFNEDSVRRKLARWFWSGVFGELYSSSLETRFAFDIQDVLGWLDGGELPRTIRDSNFAPLRLLSLQSRLSAAYKGMGALLMQEGSLDFLSGDALDLNRYFDEAVDIHHIFPQAYCESSKVRIPKRKWNSVVNKAPLSSRTNKLVGGRAPSAYLHKLVENKHIPRERLDEILATHLIDPERLWSDDFDGFLAARATKMCDLIERATGKQVTGRDSDEVALAFGRPLVT